MLQQKKCNAFLLGMLCIVIKVIEETEGEDWSKECYDKECHIKLLQNGKKFTWPQAYDLCRKERGYLLDETLIKTMRKTEEFMLLQRVVNGTDTWTSLQLVNDYIQEVTKYTSYSQSVDEIWEMNPVWNKDMCIKLTAQNNLKAVNCSTKLSVVCARDLEEINEVSDCSMRLKPTVTVKVSGKAVNIQNGNVELKIDDRKNVIFNCGGLESKSRIDWIKDGIYLKRRIDTILPAITTDPSIMTASFITNDPSKAVNVYSMQGIYWCEAWTPGCRQKFSSNKVNLIFKGIITVYLHLKQKNGNIHGGSEFIKDVNENFKLCGTETSIDCDVRRGYTDVMNRMVATYNLYMYMRNDNLSCDVNQYVSEAGRKLSAKGIVSYGISFQPVCLKKFNAWQQAEQKECGSGTNEKCRTCPEHFFLLETYCVHITKPATWINAYQNCFRTGIEKTPLDIKRFWMNADLLENLKCFLKEEQYIWLAAERKLAGGPIYYSGPVASDFNYNFNNFEEYNISWIQSDYKANNKCLALNIVQKELQVLSCESTLPFVCLFPSEFWTHSITYDSFHVCHENCSGDYKLEGGIPWEDARKKCRQNGGDVIHKQSAYFTNDLYSSKANTSYIGKHNTEKPSSDNPLQYNFTHWIGSEIERVYRVYNTGFELGHINETSKEYACLPGQSLAVPKVYIDEMNFGNYIINIHGIEEISYLYGINCYLNGERVKSDGLPRLTIIQQGYLFCEVLTHLPVLLLKSNVILVQNPEVVTFACQIFDQNQNYASKLHDFSLHSESVGSISYYRMLLKEKLIGFEISIHNISASSFSPGIYIDFHIELLSHESKLEEMYLNISNIMLPGGKEVDIGNRKLHVSYIRSTKYCMEEIINVESNLSNCTTGATWPATIINETVTLQQCVTCQNEVLTRSCLGDFNTGAVWGPVKKLFLFPNSKLNFFMCKDVLHAAKELINDTVESIKKNVEIYSALDTYSTTNKFIRQFETLFIGKNVNDTFETDDGPVSIYSMSLQHDILRFMYKGNGSRFIIKAGDNSENEEDVTMVIHFILNITAEYKNDVSLLISVFQNTTLFPQKQDNLILSSSVLLINVTNETSIQFPIKVFFNSDTGSNSSEEMMCAFWNEETHKWDVERSEYNGTTSIGLHECLYYHLSCFALLFRADNKEHLATLSILSRAGCYLSLTGLALVLFTFVFFHKWRLHLESKITASLSLSLFVMYLVFVTGFTQTSNEFLCIIVAATLHYFILASFCWMFVEAFYNYLKFVKVIGTYIPRFMWKASAGAWGSPLIPVIAVFCYNYKLYRDEQYCWIHSEAFYYAFLTPLAVTCGANIVIFIVIINSITCARQHLKTNQQQYSLLISQLNVTFCIFVLLGLSWTFGFLTLIETGLIFNYLFCITSTLQGFIIFVYFISLGRREKRMWCKLFAQCYCLKNDTDIDKTQTSNLRSVVQTSSEL